MSWASIKRPLKLINALVNEKIDELALSVVDMVPCVATIGAAELALVAGGADDEELEVDVGVADEDECFLEWLVELLVGGGVHDDVDVVSGFQVVVGGGGGGVELVVGFGFKAIEMGGGGGADEVGAGAEAPPKSHAPLSTPSDSEPKKSNRPSEKSKPFGGHLVGIFDQRCVSCDSGRREGTLGIHPQSWPGWSCCLHNKSQQTAAWYIDRVPLPTVIVIISKQ